jgi:hypothetical protein
MRVQMALLAAAGLALGAGAAKAATLEIKDAVARVTVIPEARSDIKVEVVRPNGRLPLTMRTMGDRTILDGDLGHNRIHSCRGDGENVTVEVRRAGTFGWNDMPQVVIHTPRDVKVEAGGAVFGSVGRAASVDLGNSGCGDWTLANVEGVAKISQAGSGDTRMGSAGGAKFRLAGSGDVATADIRGGLDITIAGSGSARVKSISGPLSVSIAGSGNVAVDGGRASEMRVRVAGSGDVDFRGVADNLKAEIAGSGDVHANEVKGAVTKTIFGSGSVKVGG